MQLLSNTELQNGKFRILRVLGQGGFGITYLAENVALGRKVAIKEFFPKDFCGRDATTRAITSFTGGNSELLERLKKRFLKEARNIAALDHPGIVKIHDIFEENGTAYYVMDYIEGENLNEMVKRDGAMPEARAVGYIRKVGETLSYIHGRNMTHFDVKPANIVVRRSDDMPILIDFGLSKQYDIHGDATSTALQGISHGYSAIEMYNPATVATFSPQSDVYSLGATLYCLVTGAVPPSASDIVQGGLRTPECISDNISRPMMKAMNTSKASRYPSVSAFLIDLAASVNTTVDKYKKQVNRDEYATEQTQLLRSEYPSSNYQPNTHVTNDYSETNRSSSSFLWWLIGIGVIAVVLCVVLWSPASDSDTVHHANPIASSNLGGDGMTQNHEWVDLGLPSGTKWATCNVGASSPNERGDFFNWGSVMPMTSYSGTCSSYESRLPIEIGGNGKYDAATHFWGSSWQTPSLKQYRELVDYCNIKSDIAVNGKVIGYTIIGPNGHEIYLSRSGWWPNNGISAGAVYWTSTTTYANNSPISGYVNKGTTAYSFDPNAASRGGGEGFQEWPRYFGMPIRPVTK